MNNLKQIAIGKLNANSNTYNVKVVGEMDPRIQNTEVSAATGQFDLDVGARKIWDAAGDLTVAKHRNAFSVQTIHAITGAENVTVSPEAITIIIPEVIVNEMLRNQALLAAMGLNVAEVKTHYREPRFITGTIPTEVQTTIIRPALKSITERVRDAVQAIVVPGMVVRETGKKMFGLGAEFHTDTFNEEEYTTQVVRNFVRSLQLDASALENLEKTTNRTSANKVTAGQYTKPWQEAAEHAELDEFIRLLARSRKSEHNDFAKTFSKNDTPDRKGVKKLLRQLKGQEFTLVKFEERYCTKA